MTGISQGNPRLRHPREGHSTTSRKPLHSEASRPPKPSPPLRRLDNRQAQDHLATSVRHANRIRRTKFSTSVTFLAQSVTGNERKMSDLKGEPVGGECGDLLNKYFLSDFRAAYKRYRGVCLPTRHDAFAQRVETMEVRNDDVWVVSYPKTGTTWTQEMVWCIANNLDFEGAKEFLPQRFPFLEHSCLFDYGDVLPRKPGLKLPPFVEDSVGFVGNLKSPRFIKTHLPWELLPASIRNGQKLPKIIYVCRNPKDTCVSYYHHCILLEGYRGNFDDFCKLFLGDSLCFSPFWSHIDGFWKRRNQPNVLFLRYEDMKKDLPSIIKQTAKFLGKQLTQEQIDVLCEHLSFSSMKNNPAVNYEAVVEINRTFDLIPADGEFMRKGTGGEWKEKMSDEMIKKFDKWTEENISRTGIQM